MALSMVMVFGMPFSSLVKTWLLTSMRVNCPIVRDSNLFYRVELFLSSAMNAKGEGSHNLVFRLKRLVEFEPSCQGTVCPFLLFCQRV